MSKLLTVTIVLCTATSIAAAEEASGTCALVMDPNNAPSTDPRVDHLVVDGVHVTVAVPPRYRTNHHHYPVLYLFHGAFGDEDSWTTQTDLLAFTAGLDDDDQAIVVMPDGGHLPAGRDWIDGTHDQETFVITELLPFIDAHYRTRDDRAHRAAAGFSAGGLDAMVFTARHPDLFVAAGSFSGFVDPIDPTGVSVIQQFADLDDQLCGATTDWRNLWGDPALHPMGWEGHDPTNLAINLQDSSLYIASGNGTECVGDPVDPFLEFAEATVDAMSHHFDEALDAAHVHDVTDFRTCGVHLYSHAGQDLRQFWPQMFHAFGRQSPREFDFRVSDPVASVWGWTFAADSARAPEFLDVREASSHGVIVTGSGTESIVTAAVFSHRQHVRVIGAGGAPQILRADPAGRLAFTVDLGVAHSLEQDTPAELAAAASPSYFTTRHIRFELFGD